MPAKDLGSRLEKYVLQNAIFHSGKADPSAVLGKVLGQEHDLRSRAPEVRKALQSLTSSVNRLSLADQEERLSSLDPSMLEKQEKKQEELPPLKNAVTGKVVTRFAPSPTGPLNIAQLLRAAMMNYLYAEKYKGRFIVRIEDTDPARIEKKYYDMIFHDLESAGITGFFRTIQSNSMSLFYRHALDLIKKSHAYMCSCPASHFAALKLKKRNCPHRDSSPDQNWKEFEKATKGGYNEGGIVLRFRTSMKDPNPAIRDPPIMRVNKGSHPIHKKKYSFWPLYNYANVIEDHRLGITHVFRGKEHQHNTDIQRRIYEALGWDPPTTVNFGMMYLPGEKLHTRDIREGIASGKYSGWDDPRLHTVQALVRRGFAPDSFRGFAIQVGLTRNDIRLSWDALESFNRTAIDPLSNRFMVVTDPVRITLKGFPEKSKAELENHPDFPERGTRTIPLGKHIHISRPDWKRFQGRTIRLKNLSNITLKARTATHSGDDIVQSMPKIQWVTEPGLKLSIIMPDRSIPALGETSLKSLSKGDLLQMERLGYGRVDRRSPLSIIWAHG